MCLSAAVHTYCRRTAVRRLPVDSLRLHHKSSLGRRIVRLCICGDDSGKLYGATESYDYYTLHAVHTLGENSHCYLFGLVVNECMNERMHLFQIRDP